MRNTILLEKGWTFYKNPQSETGEAVTLPPTWNAVDGQDGGNDSQNRNWKREEERIWNLTAQR